VGGPAANYFFASVLFFASFLWGGRMVTPEQDEPGSTEVTVLPDRAAAAATMRTGDRIVEVDHVAVDRWKDMAALISKHPGATVPFVVDRKGERITLTITPANEQGKGKIGVSSFAHHEALTPKQSAVLAVTAPPMVVKNVVLGLGNLVVQLATRGSIEGELSGPVGMVKEGAKVARGGWTDLLSFLGMLSAYLGAFNLVPFPALDGGRMIFLGYEATTRRRPNARIEAQIHLVGIVTMLGLMVYVTVNDFRRVDHPAQPEAPPAATSAPAPAPSGK
jgi:regulator of sigma E protease